jgi:hypothetical protein
MVTFIFALDRSVPSPRYQIAKNTYPVNQRIGGMSVAVCRQNGPNIEGARIHQEGKQGKRPKQSKGHIVQV